MRAVRIRYPIREEDEETIDDQIGIHQKLTLVTHKISRLYQRIGGKGSPIPALQGTSRAHKEQNGSYS